MEFCGFLDGTFAISQMKLSKRIIPKVNPKKLISCRVVPRYYTAIIIQFRMLWPALPSGCRFARNESNEARFVAGGGPGDLGALTDCGDSARGRSDRYRADQVLDG